MVSNEYDVISSERSSGFSYIKDISCLLIEYSKVKIVYSSLPNEAGGLYGTCA